MSGVFRREWPSYYNPRRKFVDRSSAPPASVGFSAISKVHPSRNLTLRDGTFRPLKTEYYFRRKVFLVAPFVPKFSIGPSKIHPSRNPGLRDGTFDLASLQHYQPKRAIAPGVSTGRNILGQHPALRYRASEKQVDYRYYQLRRSFPLSTPVVPDVSTIGVSRNHPSRNLSLRRRDSIEWQYYEIRHAIPPSIFIPGVLVLVSKIHPSRNIILRDGTFEIDYLKYYQPRHAASFGTPVVSTGLSEVLFKGMWRGMYRRMR